MRRRRYANPASGCSTEIGGRTLVAHEEEGYEEWGLSGALRIDPGANGRGLSLSIMPSAGRAGSGLEHLWSSGVDTIGESETGARIDTEVGYGTAVLGQFTGTPYVALGVSDRSRDWRVGWRLQGAGSGDGPARANTTKRRPDAQSPPTPRRGAAAPRPTARANRTNQTSNSNLLR